MLPETPSIEQLSRIIGSVAAPAFLLGAVAAFISVLISRMNRVIDQSQFLHSIADNDLDKSYLKTDIPRLTYKLGSHMPHVRCWHFSDMANLAGDVRF